MVFTDFQLLAKSSSGLGTLGVSGPAIIIESITFILGFLVLRKWAFGPIIRVLRERRELIEKGVNLGEEMKKERAKLEEEVEHKISEARIKADAILADAAAEAKDAIHKAEGDALARAEVIINEAKEQTKQDIARAKKQLEGEIISLLSDATEVLVGEKVDPKKDADLVRKALAGRVEE